jgi:outer membrane murein-binding lipoprotein Lpp
MLATTHSSSLKGREELKRRFSNGIKLSDKHFEELIYATLNKRDDHFHGIWQAGQTYRNQDIVYYDHHFWEMTEETAGEEICGGIEIPGQSTKWKSRLKELEAEVKTLEQQLKDTQKELQALQQEVAHFKQQVSRFLSLLTLGFGFLFLWLCLSAIAHLI